MMAPGLMICMTTGKLTDLDIESDGQGQGQVPPPTPRQPYDAYTPPVGCFIAPHRCPNCEISQLTYFPCLPTLLLTLTLHPVMMTCFHLATPHSQTSTPTYVLVSTHCPIHYHLPLPSP